jgi:nucleotide-binding universal stress UspA family protein
MQRLLEACDALQLRCINLVRGAGAQHVGIPPTTRTQSMKILLPVDGSEYTRRMLGYVAAHDEMFGPGHDYIVVTAVAPLPNDVVRFLDRSTVEDYQRSQAEAVLEPVRAFAKQKGWKLRASHVVGHAAEAIAAMAEREQPDVIVMGSHGHSALGGLVLGSVTTGVLARTKAPVLIVR